MRKVLLGMMVVIAALVAATFLRPKISRDALGIASGDIARCEAPRLPTYPRPGYERRVAANDYLSYAVAAMNVYLDGVPKGFTLEKHSPEWKRVESVKTGGGMALDVYERDVDGHLRTLVAFRGTDNLDRSDWAANFSWLLAWLPVETQYDQARTHFMRIRKAAMAKAGQRRVGFIAAGHSLGGGLAQHVAQAFPCTVATVFNSSFVTNRFRLGEPFDNAQIIHVFEDLDELTRLRRLLFIDRETDTYKHYRQDAVADRVEFQHSMTGLAVGTARQVVRCQQKRAECPVPATDQRARNLYCASWGKATEMCKAG